MAVEAAMQPSKMRWGELEEDDGEDLDFLLLPKQVLGPDENGIKKVVEYRFNDEGNKVKITTTTRVRKLANSRLSKQAVERRSWPKFGDAVHVDVGSRLTMVSTEEILLERSRTPGTKQEETTAPGDHLVPWFVGPVGRKVITGHQGVLTRIVLNQVRPSLISYHPKLPIILWMVKREHMYLQACEVIILRGVVQT